METPDPKRTVTDPTKSLPASPDESLEAGLLLLLPERYTLGPQIGKGGFGRVFAGRDRIQDRDVALKILSMPSSRAALQLQRETSALRLLDLPGIVRLLDSGGAAGKAWFVMERVHGKPFPGSEGQISWESLQPLAIELLRALASIHRAGFVHGDLKPSNVLVRSDGMPVVLDLGLARTVGDPAKGGAGTPLFMAPEQLRGEVAAAGSDLFAVGLMLWHALTGRWPHADLPPEEILQARLTVDPAPFTECGIVIPEPVARMIDAMVARDLVNRPASALECVRQLMREDPPLSIGDLCTSQHDLARLFRGRERLLHVPSAAASILWKRSAGEAQQISDTIDEWLALGVMHREGAQFVVPERTLDMLLAGWVPEAASGRTADVAELGSPLSLCGFLARRDDGQVAKAALTISHQERSKGNLGAAAVCLLEGLRACWRTNDLSREAELVWAAVDLALTDRSLAAVDAAIDLLGRSRIHNERALVLLRAARALQDGRRGEAVVLLQRAELSDTTDLQRFRHELRVQAAVDGPLDVELIESIRNEIDLWASKAGPEMAPHVHRWRARLLYRLARMAEAGQEAEVAAQTETAAFDLLNALLAAATAWIETGDVERTVAIARRALTLAVQLRLPRLEARAEWLLRAVANRTGVATGPDLELVEAARELRSPHLEGLITVTEAVIAWRTGHGAAHELARAAESAFDSAGYAAAGIFARAMAIASGPEDASAATKVATEACAARRPDVAMEVLGILSLSGKLTGDWRTAFEEQVAMLPVQDPDWRSGALSLNEARSAIVSAAGS